VRLTVVHNRTAGDGRPSGDDLQAMLAGAGYQVDYQTTDGKWKKALQRDTDLVVVAGGDGTVRRVAVELAGRGIPMTIVPLGTANNIGKSFGIHGTLEEVAAEWRRTQPTPLDLGVVSGPLAEARFVEGFGAGVFSRLIARGEEEVEDATTILGRETDRAVYLLRDIVREAPAVRWTVTADGEDCSGDYIAVEVLNMRFGGPNVPLAPEADPGDGVLDLVLIDEDGRRQLLDYLTGRLTHAAGPLPHLDVRRARHVTMRAEGDVPFHVDDARWNPYAEGPEPGDLVGEARDEAPGVPEAPGRERSDPVPDHDASAPETATPESASLPKPQPDGTIDVVIRPAAAAIVLASLP
jgi:diacylglycerol kinase (ATP)